jgi:hypothetical protein
MARRRVTARHRRIPAGALKGDTARGAHFGNLRAQRIIASARGLQIGAPDLAGLESAGRRSSERYGLHQ